MNTQRPEAAYARDSPVFRQAIGGRATDAEHFGRLGYGYQAHCCSMPRSAAAGLFRGEVLGVVFELRYALDHDLRQLLVEYVG